METDFSKFKDEELALLAQKGNDRAEEFLIRKYIGQVKAKSRLYFIAGADSQDVIQEGMIGLYHAVKNYEPERDASFATYADKCATNQIFQAIRRANRLKYSPLNDSVSLDSKPSGEESASKNMEGKVSSDLIYNPETMMLMQELTNILWSEEGSILSEKEMRVWTEYLKGKNRREISTSLDMSYKSVDNAMQRIKRKIVDFLIA